MKKLLESYETSILESHRNITTTFVRLNLSLIIKQDMGRKKNVLQMPTQILTQTYEPDQKPNHEPDQKQNYAKLQKQNDQQTRRENDKHIHVHKRYHKPKQPPTSKLHHKRSPNLSSPQQHFLLRIRAYTKHSHGSWSDLIGLHLLNKRRLKTKYIFINWLWNVWHVLLIPLNHSTSHQFKKYSANINISFI